LQAGDCSRPCGAARLRVAASAGTGILTSALARGGAHVIAVEIDHELATDLRRRFPKVVEGDAARLEVPREPFEVVANLPFGDGTAILRRLLHPGVSLMTADVSFVPRTSTARTRRLSHAVTATDRVPSCRGAR